MDAEGAFKFMARHLPGHREDQRADLHWLPWADPSNPLTLLIALIADSGVKSRCLRVVRFSLSPSLSPVVVLEFSKELYSQTSSKSHF